VNAFNRLVMLVIALLLIAVPVLILLLTFGVIPPDLANSYTGYRNVGGALSGISGSSLASPLVRAVVVVVALLVALVALLLLLRELTFGRRVSRSAIVDNSPGKEVVVTSGAVKSLAEGAIREAGTEPDSLSLATEKGAYRVFCNVLVPEEKNVEESAANAREKVLEVLGGQSVPLKDVEVTVRGTTRPDEGRA
jgi:multisubunit Na+/H+ antiporter MnhC subunit